MTKEEIIDKLLEGGKLLPVMTKFEAEEVVNLVINSLHDISENVNEYVPIGSDSIKIYGFRFGMYRYQVEHFDHNHSGNEMNNKNDRIIKCIDFYDTLYGTRIYRFNDGDIWHTVETALYLNDYIEEDELKEMILNDVIEWRIEDPYDFKDRFITSRFDALLSRIFKKDKEDVKLPYPECETPYNKCPICGGELDESVLEMENAVDVFNSHVGTNYWGEPDGWWHEVHRCPHCDKLFFIEESC